MRNNSNNKDYKSCNGLTSLLNDKIIIPKFNTNNVVVKQTTLVRNESTILNLGLVTLLWTKTWIKKLA